MIRPSTHHAFANARRAFSLVELLVVIGIIALLAGILFPTISKVRAGAQNADSQSFLNQIDQACQAYYTDFKAYPGPFSYTMLNAIDQTNGGDVNSTIYDSQTGTTVIDRNQVTYATGVSSSVVPAFFGPNAETRITGAENLLLGLCGGLAKDATNGRYYFDASAVGSGPLNFNPLRPGRTTAYLQPSSISKGRITNEAGNVTGVDSIIPEFQDRFATPMPYLYMRSRNQSSAATTVLNENLIVDDASVDCDYNIVEIQPYTNYPTGAGSTLNPSDYKNVMYSPTQPHGLRICNRINTIDKNNKIPGLNLYVYPYDAFDYFVDPSSYDRTQASAPTAAQYAGKRSRKKDSYVLVSAGKDRIYGTADDLTNFGSVLP